ncbi:MAG: hypothetical protein BGO49_25200 [Planctomycetales bacterium 71-10]|nr:MAG: hypothetical protein BGO49_25200 [Planctomycetales bacterium 71-10]
MTTTMEIDRDAMVVGNLGLVYRTADRYLNRGLDRDDLVSEGVIGLMKAVGRFDPALGFRFSTYATYWIRQAIGRAVHDKGTTVRIPVHMGQKLNAWRRAEKALYLETGHRPGFDDVADRLGLDDEAREITAKALAASRAGGGSEVVEVEGEAAPVDLDEPDGSRAELLRRLEGLSDLHRAVLILRFGLGGEEPLKLREVADRLECSRRNVHQLEAQALRLLGLERDGGPKSGGLRKIAAGGGGTP